MTRLLFSGVFPWCCRLENPLVPEEIVKCSKSSAFSVPSSSPQARAVAYREEAVDGMSVPAYDLAKVPRGALDKVHDHLASL